MREMIPIVVGMIEPLPCERVSSFLGKSSLMHSVSWIRSLQFFLLERRANWNVLEILNDFFGACVSAFFSIFFYDVGLLEVEKSFILHMVSMVFLLCSYGEPSYVIKWICQYCSWCSWSSKWCLQLCLDVPLEHLHQGLPQALLMSFWQRRVLMCLILFQGHVQFMLSLHALCPQEKSFSSWQNRALCVCESLCFAKSSSWPFWFVFEFFKPQSWASHSFVLLVWSLSCYCEELGSSWLCSCFFFCSFVLLPWGAKLLMAFFVLASLLLFSPSLFVLLPWGESSSWQLWYLFFSCLCLAFCLADRNFAAPCGFPYSLFFSYCLVALQALIFLFLFIILLLQGAQLLDSGFDLAFFFPMIFVMFLSSLHDFVFVFFPFSCSGAGSRETVPWVR